MTLEYITMREMENSKGEVKGRIRIMKTKEETSAMVDITCPECGYNEKRREEWREPFVTGLKMKQAFFLKCSKCAYSVKMLKLKKEAAKKAKAAKK
ncbi:MAG: hypothetical protein HY833_02425 [Candidatus Aenigmarchaeota archaeon]|nr:hypothetical protein [Candidatus Aenigmarchaeota archaeon]